MIRLGFGVVRRTWRDHPRLMLAPPAAGLLAGWVAGFVWQLRPWVLVAH